MRIPGLLLYAAVRKHDAELRKEAIHLLRTAARRKSATHWPGPVASYLLGKCSTAAFLASVSFGDPPLPLQQRHRCQADFNIGVRALMEEDQPGFEASMRACAASPNGFLEHEYYLAIWETEQGFPELSRAPTLVHSTRAHIEPAAAPTNPPAR